MLVAVTYDNEMVGQHFGHCEKFKIYNVDEEGKVVTSEVVDTDGAGHEALADFLYSACVDSLICGGIGPGALEALSQCGIKVYAGVYGDCDDALVGLLTGELVAYDEPTCESHAGGGSCGGHCGSGCGSHCGGGCH